MGSSFTLSKSVFASNFKYLTLLCLNSGSVLDATITLLLSARIFEILPKPLITRDQLRLLKYDNILSGKYKTNSDIGMPSKRYFNDEVKN